MPANTAAAARVAAGESLRPADIMAAPRLCEVTDGALVMRPLRFHPVLAQTSWRRARVSDEAFA